MAENAENLAALTARMHEMAISCQRGKGDATSHYAARRLRLAAAVGSVKWPSSRRTALHKSKKVYDRKRLKRTDINPDDAVLFA